LKSVTRRQRPWSRVVILAPIAALILVAMYSYHLYVNKPQPQPAPLTTSSSVSAPPPATPVKPADDPDRKSPAKAVDGLVYVWVPAGKFQMGCSPADSDCESDEKPAHWVTIEKGFWMGETEVTNEAYIAYAHSKRLQAPQGPAKEPVAGVDRSEAKAFC